MQSTIPALTVAVPRIPFLLSPASLAARFLTLTDRRDRRGIRSPLAVLLTVATLAKRAEQNAPRAIADWARKAAVTVRWAGARSTPASSTWAWSQTRLEKSSAKGRSSSIIAGGRVCIQYLLLVEW